MPATTTARGSGSVVFRTQPPTSLFTGPDSLDTLGQPSGSSSSSRRPLRRSLAMEPVESTDASMEPVNSATKRTFAESDTEFDVATSGEDMVIDDGDERAKRLRRTSRTRLDGPRATTSTLRQRRPSLSLTGRLPPPRGFMLGSDGMLSPGSPSRPMLPRNATAVTPPELTPPIPFNGENHLFGATVDISSDEEDEEEDIEIDWPVSVAPRGTEARAVPPQQETSGERIMRTARERDQRMAILRQELRSPTNIPQPPRPTFLNEEYITPPMPSEPFAPPMAPRFPNSEAAWSRYIPGTTLSPSVEVPPPAHQTWAQRQEAIANHRAVTQAAAGDAIRAHGYTVADHVSEHEAEQMRAWGHIAADSEPAQPYRSGALNSSRMRGPTVSRNEEWLQRDTERRWDRVQAMAVEERARADGDGDSRIRGVIRDLRARYPVIAQLEVNDDSTARSRAARLAQLRAAAAASRARAEEGRRDQEAQQGGNIQRTADFDPFGGLPRYAQANHEILARIEEHRRRTNATNESPARIAEPFNFAHHAQAMSDLLQDRPEQPPPPRLPFAPFAARRAAAEPTTPGDPFFNPGLTQNFLRPPRRTGPWEWLQPGRGITFGALYDGAGADAGYRSMLNDPRNYMPEFDWDYDMLTALGDTLGEVKRRTATADEVAKDDGLKTATAAEMIKAGEPRCPICLCDYEEDETLRRLKCNHAFHQECVENWLTEGQNNCPTCRRPAVATVS